MQRNENKNANDTRTVGLDYLNNSEFPTYIHDSATGVPKAGAFVGPHFSLGEFDPGIEPKFLGVVIDDNFTARLQSELDNVSNMAPTPNENGLDNNTRAQHIWKNLLNSDWNKEKFIEQLFDNERHDLNSPLTFELVKQIGYTEQRNKLTGEIEIAPSLKKCGNVNAMRTYKKIGPTAAAAAAKLYFESRLTKRNKENINAILECIAADVLRQLNIETHIQRLTFNKYSDGYPYIGTACRYYPNMRGFDNKNGPFTIGGTIKKKDYQNTIVYLNDQTKSANLAYLGMWRYWMIATDNCDFGGSLDGNKGALELKDAEGNIIYKLFVFDCGHSYDTKEPNPFVSNLKDDFSFRQNDATKKFKNISSFSGKLSEMMLGPLADLAMTEKNIANKVFSDDEIDNIKTVIDSYKELYPEWHQSIKNLTFMDGDKKITLTDDDIFDTYINSFTTLRDECTKEIAETESKLKEIHKEIAEAESKLKEIRQSAPKVPFFSSISRKFTNNKKQKKQLTETIKNLKNTQEFTETIKNLKNTQDCYNEIITEVEKAKNIKNANKIKLLEVFKERMSLTQKEVDMLDNLEKLTSDNTTTKSPDGKVELNYIRLSNNDDRVVWQIETHENIRYLVGTPPENKKINKKIEKIKTTLADFDRLNDCNGKLFASEKLTINNNQIKIEIKDNTHLSNLVNLLTDANLRQFKEKLQNEAFSNAQARQSVRQSHRTAGSAQTDSSKNLEATIATSIGSDSDSSAPVSSAIDSSGDSDSDNDDQEKIKIQTLLSQYTELKEENDKHIQEQDSQKNGYALIRNKQTESSKKLEDCKTTLKAYQGYHGADSILDRVENYVKDINELSSPLIVKIDIQETTLSTHQKEIDSQIKTLSEYNNPSYKKEDNFSVGLEHAETVLSGYKYSQKIISVENQIKSITTLSKQIDAKVNKIGAVKQRADQYIKSLLESTKNNLEKIAGTQDISSSNHDREISDLEIKQSELKDVIQLAKKDHTEVASFESDALLIQEQLTQINTEEVQLSAKRTKYLEAKESVDKSHADIIESIKNINTESSYSEKIKKIEEINKSVSSYEKSVEDLELLGLEHQIYDLILSNKIEETNKKIETSIVSVQEAHIEFLCQPIVDSINSEHSFIKKIRMEAEVLKEIHTSSSALNTLITERIDELNNRINSYSRKKMQTLQSRINDVKRSKDSHEEKIKIIKNININIELSYSNNLQKNKESLKSLLITQTNKSKSLLDNISAFHFLKDITNSIDANDIYQSADLYQDFIKTINDTKNLDKYSANTLIYLHNEAKEQHEMLLNKLKRLDKPEIHQKSRELVEKINLLFRMLKIDVQFSTIGLFKFSEIFKKINDIEENNLMDQDSPTILSQLKCFINTQDFKSESLNIILDQFIEKEAKVHIYAIKTDMKELTDKNAKGKGISKIQDVINTNNQKAIIQYKHILEIVDKRLNSKTVNLFGRFFTRPTENKNLYVKIQNSMTRRDLSRSRS